jgi:DNA-binding SARP family transcriptional activator/energy-coupling factor transporter ATP-binding protein EcfA2
MVNRLRIHLLGSLELWREGQMVSPNAWPSRKVRQLLGILVTHRHRTVSSDELIEWLWPDLGLESAHNSLWVTVSHLRRVLEPELAGRVTSTFVLTEPPGYRFDPAERCEIDVEAFLALVREGQSCQQRDQSVSAIDAYLAALALYRGDYMAQDPYEDWAIPTRERLRETLQEMRSNLAVCYLALGRYQEALDHARQVLDRDPCRERAWRLVMEAYYRQGEQDRALRAFERCRAILADELGVDPLPETVTLHERILQTPPPLPRRTPAALPPALSMRLPFVGREREWIQLSGVLQQALDGRGQIVLVAGEPGIGKTRLLEELAGLATARGARVLMGCCYEMEQNMAYAPVVEALRSLLASPRATESPPPCPPAQLAAVAGLLPELRKIWPDLPPYQPMPPDAERTRLLTSLVQVIQLCAQGKPLILLLDDLQWADPSSLQLIHHLARQSEGHPLLLVGAYRSTHLDRGHALTALRQRLAPQNRLVELSLTAFRKDDVVLLLRILGNSDSGDALARRLYHETEGHPFFLAEVLHTLVQEGLDLATVTEEPGADERWLLPPGVRAVAMGRLDRLAADDRAVLDHASVVGREFALSLLAHFLDRPERVLAEQAERLCARGFLRPRMLDRYEFSHDLMRRAAYEALSEPRRRLLHRQLADILRTQEAAAGTVATHYAAGDRPWLALEPALIAAQQAGHLTAYDEALAWCQQAMSIAEAHPQAVPPGFRTRLHLQCRTLWYYRGDLERTLGADRAALAAARHEGDLASELEALWHLAHDETQMAAGGPSGLQAEALALANNLGDPAALARSLARHGSDSGFLATPAERESALQALNQAVSLARQVGDAALLHHVLCELWGVGRLPPARAALEEALALVRRLGDRHEEVGTLAKLADLLARQGDFPAVVEYACQGLTLAEQVDSTAYGAWNRRAWGQALAALGQIEEGIAHLRGAAQTFETLTWRTMLAGSLLRLGLALRLAGDWAGATAALERVLALSQETHEVYEAAYALAALGELRLAQGETEAGSRALVEAAALAPQVGLPWHRGGALLHIAGGWLTLGQFEAALPAAQEAICLAEEEDLREVRARGLRLRSQAQNRQLRPFE